MNFDKRWQLSFCGSNLKYLVSTIDVGDPILHHGHPFLVHLFPLFDFLFGLFMLGVSLSQLNLRISFGLLQQALSSKTAWFKDCISQEWHELRRLTLASSFSMRKAAIRFLASLSSLVKFSIVLSSSFKAHLLLATDTYFKFEPRGDFILHSGLEQLRSEAKDFRCSEALGCRLSFWLLWAI